MGIKFKRSAVAGKVPAVADLELGEIAINTTDGRLFTKKSVSGTESIVPVGEVRTVAGRSGDVSLAIADVAALQTALDGKAASVHGHVAGDVAGLGALALLNAVGSSQISDGAVTLAKLAAAVQALLVPAGSLMSYAGAAAPTGWLLCAGGTIGSASSGATARANADTQTLYELLWNGFANTELPIQTSTGVASTRGASATADFTANKRLQLPDLRGRVPVGKDDMGGTAASRITTAGSGVDGATLGASGGAETHTLTTAQMPAHQHLTVGNTSATLSSSTAILETASYGNNSSYDLTGSSSWSKGATSSVGSGSAHNNTQPSIILNYIIKM